MTGYIIFVSDRSEDPAGPDEAVDLLSEMLRALHLTGGMKYDAALGAPWGFEVAERKNSAPFYIVTEGECVIEPVEQEADRAGEPLEGQSGGGRIAAGDLAMIPMGRSHVLKDAHGSPVVPFESLAAGAHGSGSRPTIYAGRRDGPSTKLLIGEFRFESPLTSAALVGMDRVIYARSIREESPPTFEPILRALCQEQQSNLPGSQAATEGLVKLLFIHVLRREMARRRQYRGTCKGTTLALMFDPSLHGVAELLHRFPERPWTVGALAEEAYMSRTSFAVKFTETTGMSPFAYLTHIRMLNAIELLSTTNLTLEEIAQRIGYGSEAAFSAAFKREIGVAPGAYRRGLVAAEAGAK